MVSRGSEEEEASPLLEVVTPEEHGVRGIKVSSRILRSCCDERDSFLRTLEHFSAYVLLVHWCANTPLHGTFSPPLPPPSVLFPTPPSAFPAPVCTSPVTVATDGGEKQQRAPAENPLKVCTFQQEKTRSTNRLKKKTLKGFLVWKSDIKMLLYASK